MAQGAGNKQVGTDYMNLVQRIPYLSREEEVELATRYQRDGDERAKQRLLAAHLRFVVKVARGFKAYSMDIDDLIAEGNLGLVRAIETFDVTRDLRFATYAQWWVKHMMFDAVYRNAAPIKMPNTPGLKKSFFRLRSAKAKLGILSTGDIPHEHAVELAEEFGVTLDQIHFMNSIFVVQASLDAPNPSLDSGQSYLDGMVCDEPRPDETYLAKERRELYARLTETGLAVLSEREKDIMRRRTLAADPLTLEALSLEYSVTRERIRQIENKAIAKFSKVVRRQANFDAPLTGYVPVAA